MPLAQSARRFAFAIAFRSLQLRAPAIIDKAKRERSCEHAYVAPRFDFAL